MSAHVLALTAFGFLLWWILAGPEPASLIIGLPAVAAAVWAHRRLSRPPNNGHTSATDIWRMLSGLPRFAGFFLTQSVLGGLDVARRALAPKPRLNPGFLDFSCAIRNPASRLLFVNCISLLPGTLSADLQGHTLRIHYLDDEFDHHAALERLQDEILRWLPEADAHTAGETP